MPECVPIVFAEGGKWDNLARLYINVVVLDILGENIVLNLDFDLKLTNAVDDEAIVLLWSDDDNISWRIAAE